MLLEAEQWDKTEQAFQQALSEEPSNTHALWGQATIELHRKSFEAARDSLEALLDIDPDYKFGEASLAYGKALFALEHWQQARSHLQQDVKNWSHPEASLMLAKILVRDRETEAARGQLERMMFKLKASPRFYYRRKQHLFRDEKSLKDL